MKMKLEHQVAAAVGAMLVDRQDITLDEVRRGLPRHLAEAGPSLKAMTNAIVSAGWVAERRGGSAIVYVPPRDPEAPGEGHNSGGEESIAADEVRLLIERAERLIEERKGIAGDIKDVWAEAKGRGYDPKALQTIVRMRAKKPEELHEQEAILEVYLRSMGMMA